MKSLISILAASALASVSMFGAASANVVNLSGVAEIECNDADDATVGCLGIVGGSLIVTNPGNQVTGGTAGSLDDTAPFTADVFGIGNNSEGNEATALNILAGTSFSAADATRTDTGGAGAIVFSTFAEYLVIATGAGQFFLRNTSGGELTIDFAQFAGQGGGLSHFTEFGLVSEVPLPAAAWLMIAGIGGLGFAGRKKKSA